MDDLLSVHDDGLLESLRSLIVTHGPAPFLRRALFDASVPVDSESRGPSLVGVGRMLHAALHVAGLGDWRFRLEDARQPLAATLDCRTAQPVFEFLAVEGRTLVFHLEYVAAPDAMLGAVCYEVGRAFLAACGGAHPYRTRAGAQDDHGQASIAGVYLGLGLVAVNSATIVRRSEEIVGRALLGQSAHIVIGALSTRDLALLLAVQLTARNSLRATDRYLGQLRGEVAARVREFIAQLEPRRDELLARLGLAPPLDDREDPLTVPALDEDTLRRLQAQEDAYQKPMRGRSAPRYYERRPFGGAFTGLLLSVPIAVALFVLRAAHSAWFVPPVLFATVGLALGLRRRVEWCGACWMLLGERERTCPKCAANLGDGVLLARRAEQPEDEDEDLVAQALAAGRGETET